MRFLSYGIGYCHLLAGLLLATACGGIKPSSPGGVTIGPHITHFDVAKVTYLTLTPDVDLSVTIEGVGARAGKLTLETSITELTRERLYAHGREAFTPRPGRQTRRVTLAVRADRMMGLLAKVRLIGGAGRVLAEAERPFDITNDLRTNFRYAGET